MSATRPDVVIRKAEPGDLARMHEIRLAAFAPVFASFRSLLGDRIDELAQAREDAAQGPLLDSLLDPGSGWDVYCAESDGRVVGFVSVQLREETRIGEIGLTAVHPDAASTGVATPMNEFAHARRPQGGMRGATVATGNDASHAPARAAYAKAGFSAQVPSVWLCRLL